MPALATAFSAGLVSAFDLAETPSAYVRRAAGPEFVDVLPELRPDSFEDLLGLALAGAPLNAVTTQPILHVPAQPPKTTDVQGATEGAAESAQRASLLATVSQNGRLAVLPSNSAIASVGSTAFDGEVGVVADIAPLGNGAAPAWPAAIDGESALPDADSPVNARGLSEAVDRTVATESVIAGQPLVSAHSNEAERAATADPAAAAEADDSNSLRPQHADDVTAGIQVVESAKASMPVQHAELSLNAAPGEEAESDVAATDSQTAETEQSIEGLRPVSEFVQDVQTVPQPETPAKTMPAAIAAETAVVLNEAVAGVTPVVASSADTRSRTTSDDGIGARAVTGRTSRDSNAARAEMPDSSGFDVTAATGEITEQALESVRGASSPSDDHTPSEEGSGTGANANSTAMTSLGLTSATGAPGSDSAPATTGSSVVQQISDAVQTWRDALQEQGTARFSAWLTPPELGNVWVELTRSADGITARLSASDDGVQSLLESQGPELRQALADSGVNISELDLSGRSPADSGSQQQQQQPPDQREEVESPVWQADAQPHRRPTPARSGAVDVRV
jgi:flagellar hook-length control protein FliK